MRGRNCGRNALSTSPDRARIVSDCRMANDAATVCQRRSLHARTARKAAEGAILPPAAFSMIDLILKLIDRCIQLLNAWKAGRIAHLNDVVAPLFAEFEALHKDYLRCFDGYRADLAKAENSSDYDRIIAQIYKDHLFSQDTRAKIQATFAMFPEDPDAQEWDPKTKAFIPPSPQARKRDSLEEFVHSISCYITGTNHVVFSDDHHLMNNFPRSSLVTGLKFILGMPAGDIGEIAYQATRSPQICIKNARSEDRHYLFALGIRRLGNPTGIPTGMWKDLQTRVAAANSDPVKIQSAIATTLVDTIVLSMQRDYRSVVEAYTALRKQASK